MKNIIIHIVLLFVCMQFLADAQQVSITRVDLMPNKPSPYLMRNWKNTALGYDSLVYNYNLTGQYLPLIKDYSNTINYPNLGSYGLQTVVGSTVPNSFEAINVLPSVVGASLCGVDKSNQNGRNYPLMCEEYFNKQNGELVYLNNPSTITGDDWWYETMPNVFFYQLNYLYPNTGDYNFQFTSVADRWLNAVKAMGGKTTPWHLPNMNYRAWNLMNNTPNTSSVPEPEASGAIAWLLYNAYTKTQNSNYRIGAEWCLEYLNSLQSNPSYELQLGYGVYTAARMNAELGTNYDIPKMVNWCFDIGPLRSWGSIVGSWGGYDVSGLIGESISNDYAFIMNTFELAGAVVPMVRYDDRFARAVGKWMLNASNSARLLYPDYLPDSLQDSYSWAHQYDPSSYISHEAIRQNQNGVSPFATGDAISGGWGLTTLALYGASHVGIFGGIIDTTNVEGILKLDLLKTDYYHAPAYPSYLFYNPFTSSQQIQFNAGTGQHNLYDAVSNTFLQSNISGVVNISIPANSAVIIVVTPSGGTLIYNLNKTLYNGVIIDYNNGQAVNNYPPRIKSLSPDSSVILINSYINVYCTAEDKDNDSLNYIWSAGSGSIMSSGSQVLYTAPAAPGDFLIRCIVDDNHGGRDTAQITIHVAVSINHPPVINRIYANPRKINLGSPSILKCFASDQDNDTLYYSWSSSVGNFTGSGSAITWNAPSTAGNYYVACTVSDNHGGSIKDSLGVEVRDLSIIQTGLLIAYFPFSGNANDSSVYHNNGFAYNVTLVPDRFNNPNRAYSFDGSTSYISVANNATLNFQNAITLNFWMKVGMFYDREQYPVSHGNWQNRWKVSITNQRVRWTVKTTTGTKDLDSETLLTLDSLYMVTCLYDGADYEIYINGQLDAFTTFSGTILTSPVNLTMGQDLPGDYNYNFNGVLDDIRIYNFGLPLDKIQSFYDIPTSVNDNTPLIPLKSILYQNYPNPFNPSTTISFSLDKSTHVTLDIFNTLGQRVVRLINDPLTPGFHKTVWNASEYSSGIYICSLTAGDKVFYQKLILLK
ncbi:MAG: T9SS type A sorting domain-containing protein [Ignavibacteriaceae bacterium]|nr:T9SS type A sorting domain-containing protein [Ignavibacteriaceae bacterium]